EILVLNAELYRQLSLQAERRPAEDDVLRLQREAGPRLRRVDREHLVPDALEVLAVSAGDDLCGRERPREVEDQAVDRHAELRAPDQEVRRLRGQADDGPGRRV